MSTIIVIGGGIIGLLTARELAQAGADVTLIEMGTTGRESSWAGGGILSTLRPWRYAEPVTDLVQWSQRRYPELCGELFERTGIDPEHSRDGLLIVDVPDPAPALSWGREHEMAMETLDGSAIRAAAPILVHESECALWLPDIAHVRNPRLIKALRRANNRAVRIREHQEVVELLVSDDRVAGVRTHTGVHHAETVVVCAGAWTANLLEQLGRAPAIAPVRGQMLLFHADPGLLSRIVLAGEHYAIPRRDGRILFGSTLEQSGFAKTTTAEAKELLHEQATTLFPMLRRMPIGGHWAGLRPSSPSGIPYIGAHPGIAGLYVNAGHFRYGLTMAPASAHLITDLILGREPILPPAPYGLDAPR